jgi:hypothetical protein
MLRSPFLFSWHGVIMARSLIAERENPPRFSLEKEASGGISLQQHVAKATKLIEEIGYMR